MMRFRSRGQWLLLLLLIQLFTIVAASEALASSQFSLRFARTPQPFSPFDSAAFEYQVLDLISGLLCRDCAVSCKLDSLSFADCNSGQVTYSSLNDGSHVFEACFSRLYELRCYSYNWTIDTVPPTAYVSAQTPFTNGSDVPVHIVFSEPCNGGGGFRCSPDHCSLLVYGAGNVLSDSLRVIQPGLEFSVNVSISAGIQYGRLVLVMDKNFCTDAAGNRFTRTLNSSFFLHFDRRPVFMNIKTRISEKLLKLDGNMRRVKATNNQRDLIIYLHFSEPVLNSSAQVLNALHASSVVLAPVNGSTLGNRRLRYKITGVSSTNVVTINCALNSILSRQGTPVSVSDPFTFLYDVQRPTVRLSTIADLRTRERSIPVFIKFMKPVFEFNSSSVLVSGGHFVSFSEVSRSLYTGIIHADGGIVSFEVPENTTEDVAGNKNLASNRLQVRHYSVPLISALISTVATTTFAATTMAAAFLTVTSASLLSSGVFSGPPTHLTLEPAKNLMKIACHIQIFALSKWLTAILPIEYYEFARGMEWSIPYINLPWENEGMNSFLKDSSLPVVTYSKLFEGKMLNYLAPNIITNEESARALYGKPLSPMEYRAFFENQNMKPEAEIIRTSQSLDTWKYFGRNMFWLALICGGLLTLHALLLLILRSRRRKVEEQKEFGALVFPRIEVFLLILALPSICQASSTLIRGRTAAGVSVGIILLSIEALLLTSLLVFLSVGIALGKFLRYKEVHKECQKLNWHNEFSRVSLGPAKRGHWSWTDPPSSLNLLRFGPLFEDLRFVSEDDSDDDAAPPFSFFFHKLLGILRIYYTFIDSAKRASFGIIAGACFSQNSSKPPILIVLSITSFQLFSVVVSKPFIKRTVQLVETVAVLSEVGVLCSCLALLEDDLSDAGQRRIGFLMLSLFAFSFSAQMMNEWYALYKQTVEISSGRNSFCQGLKVAFAGILLLVLPSNLTKEWREEFCSGERPWLRQLRQLAKASFNMEETGAVADHPSSSQNPAEAKADLKAEPMELYKDLEAIFSSN